MEVTVFGALKMEPTEFEWEVYWAASVIGDGYGVGGREISDYLELQGRAAHRAVDIMHVDKACRALYRKGWMDIYEAHGEPALYDALPVVGQRRKRVYE